MIHFWIFGTPYGLQRGHFIGKFGRFEAPNSPQYGLLVDTAMDFFCCWKNAIMKHPIAQLILVAHAAHGVSVKFFNWEDFFLLNMCNFVHIVLFHTQCVILHTLCNFTLTE